MVAGTNIEVLPGNIGGCKRLRELDVEYTPNTILPDTIVQCTRLEKLIMPSRRVIPKVLLDAISPTGIRAQIETDEDEAAGEDRDEDEDEDVDPFSPRDVWQGTPPSARAFPAGLEISYKRIRAHESTS